MQSMVQDESAMRIVPEMSSSSSSAGGSQASFGVLAESQRRKSLVKGQGSQPGQGS